MIILITELAAAFAPYYLETLHLGLPSVFAIGALAARLSLSRRFKGVENTSLDPPEMPANRRNRRKPVPKKTVVQRRTNRRRRTAPAPLMRNQMTAYRRSAPAAQGAVIRVAANANRVRISHTEFIGTIAGSIAFTALGVSINPGLAGTFPWLSNMAAIFEQYKVVSLQFIYVPSCPTTTTGNIMMSVDYDSTDPSPGSKAVQMTMADAVSSTAWNGTSLPVQPRRLSQRGNLFTRSGVVPGTDIKTYDIGIFYISTQGQAGTSIVGDVYVQYNMELSMPQLSGGPLNSLIQNTTPLLAVTGPATAIMPCGSSNLAVDASLNGVCTLQFDGVNRNALLFYASGYYLISIKFSGTGFAAGNTIDHTPYLTTGAFVNDAYRMFLGITNAALTISSFSSTIYVTEGNRCRVSLSGAASHTTTTFYTITVAPITASEYGLYNLIAV